jgi:FtsP/CotA-like multicopper oxidase with cupredoxin domain
MLSKGQRVEIDLVNRSMMAHPIHLHGNAFQVIAIRMNEMIPRKPARVLSGSQYADGIAASPRPATACTKKRSRRLAICGIRREYTPAKIVTA